MNIYSANSERTFIFDSKNKDHKRLLDEFQKDNGIDLSNFFEYDDNPNTINECLFIEKMSKMKDFCQITGVRDLKICNINTADIESKQKRKIIKQATDYALNILGMEEVFVNIPTNDETLLTSMELEGYEPITDEAGHLFFLKDKGYI